MHSIDGDVETMITRRTSKVMAPARIWGMIGALVERPVDPYPAPLLVGTSQPVLMIEFGADDDLARWIPVFGATTLPPELRGLATIYAGYNPGWYGWIVKLTAEVALPRCPVTSCASYSSAPRRDSRDEKTVEMRLVIR